MNAYYFAYGSNMNTSRMKERGVNIINLERGVLNDYKLVFNKKSFKDNTIGFANIEESKNNQVEGIIYTILYADIAKLDKFEGFPKHYNRIIMNINDKNCFVYIANKEWISESVKPTKEYIEHLLKGRDYLSEKYYESLKLIYK